MQHRFPLIALLMLSLASATIAADPPVAPPPSVEEARMRVLLGARAVTDPFVFFQDEVPAIRIDPDAALEELPKEKSSAAMVFDFKGDIAVPPLATGPYAAVAYLRLHDEVVSLRFSTLYRLAAPIEGDKKFDAGNLADLAKAAGIDERAMKRQEALVLDTIKGRPWKEASRDPRMASLLAGIKLDKTGNEPIRKNIDAFAQERQWWVGFKQMIFKPAAALNKPFNAPTMLPEQFDAPVVREGTLNEAGMKPDTPQKIDAALIEWAADTDQAFAVCVVRNGIIVHHKAYGTRDGLPMTLTTKSWMASVTKTMSATLMMMLIDRGLLDLDDNIDKFLPGFDKIKVETPLTIRHLYTHTNGMHQWPGFSDERADVEQLVAGAYPFIKVGKEWGYNGLGYTLGGKIIETISSEAIPLFYMKHLLGPLGMTHTDVIATHADARSTPLDMAKFGQMLLNKGDYGRLRFMRPETFDSMIPQRLTKTLGPDAKKTFGIGLDGTPGSGKFGHGAASAATFHVNQKDQLVVIMTRNAIGKNYDKYNGKFWKAIEDGIEREEKNAK